MNEGKVQKDQKFLDRISDPEYQSYLDMKREMHDKGKIHFEFSGDPEPRTQYTNHKEFTEEYYRRKEEAERLRLLKAYDLDREYVKQCVRVKAEEYMKRKFEDNEAWRLDNVLASCADLMHVLKKKK